MALINVQSPQHPVLPHQKLVAFAASVSAEPEKRREVAAAAVLAVDFHLGMFTDGYETSSRPVEVIYS